MTKKRDPFTTLILTVLSALFVACSGGNSALPQASIPPPSNENELARAYPTELAVASLYATDDVSTSTSATRTSAAGSRLIGDEPGASFDQKVEEIREILVADSTTKCGFRLNFAPKELRAECYGPEIEYENHPDAAPMTPDSGTLPPGDLGIWNETEGSTDQACAAAEVNALFTNISGQVDSALGMFASMLCIANNNGTPLPAANESIDLSVGTNRILTELNIDFAASTATLARLADNEEGNEVYLMTIEGESSRGKTARLILKHIPENDDNTLYRGKLALELATPESEISANCGNEEGITTGASILYEKEAETSLTYKLSRADFCGADVSALDADNNIDPSDKFETDEPSENSGGWGNNFSLVLVNIDPTSGIGNFSFAWQAGPTDANTRVFNANLADGESGLSGCAYYGYGPDIEEQETGEIDRFICNWTGPGSGEFGNKISVDKVQRQCFSQRDDGTFVSNDSLLNIAYAPTNSCDSAGGDFIFDEISGPFTNDLLDLSAIDISLPEPPENL